MKKIALRISRRPHLAVGLMSGTSHDGVSAALIRIDERRRPAIELLAFKTFPYLSRFRARLLAAGNQGAAGADELAELNFGLGRAFANAALNLVRGAGVPVQKLSFIGSHGHTFFHLPPRRARRGKIPSTPQPFRHAWAQSPHPPHLELGFLSKCLAAMSVLRHYLFA